MDGVPQVNGGGRLEARGDRRATYNAAGATRRVAFVAEVDVLAWIAAGLKIIAQKAISLHGGGGNGMSAI